MITLKVQLWCLELVSWSSAKRNGIFIIMSLAHHSPKHLAGQFGSVKPLIVGKTPSCQACIVYSLRGAQLVWCWGRWERDGVSASSHQTGWAWYPLSQLGAGRREPPTIQQRAPSSCNGRCTDAECRSSPSLLPPLSKGEALANPGRHGSTQL